MPAVILVVGVLVIALVAWGIPRWNEWRESERDYPVQVQSNFINACVGNGGTADSCQCYLNEVEKRLTIEEFLAVEAEFYQSDGRVMPREIRTAVTACF